jgi:hypothetical protein
VSLFRPASDEHGDPSDLRLHAIGRQAELRIRSSGYLALRDVTCMARGDTVHLRGRLPSHYLKQIAQEIAAGVEGVRHVYNGIEVSARPDRAGGERRTKPPQTALVQVEIGTTRGEEGLPSSTQGLKGI